MMLVRPPVWLWHQTTAIVNRVWLSSCCRCCCCCCYCCLFVVVVARPI